MIAAEDVEELIDMFMDLIKSNSDKMGNYVLSTLKKNGN